MPSLKILRCHCANCSLAKRPPQHTNGPKFPVELGPCFSTRHNWWVRLFGNAALSGLVGQKWDVGYPTDAATLLGNCKHAPPVAGLRALACSGRWWFRAFHPRSLACVWDGGWKIQGHYVLFWELETTQPLEAWILEVLFGSGGIAVYLESILNSNWNISKIKLGKVHTRYLCTQLRFRARCLSTKRCLHDWL